MQSKPSALQAVLRATGDHLVWLTPGSQIWQPFPPFSLRSPSKSPLVLHLPSTMQLLASITFLTWLHVPDVLQVALLHWAFSVAVQVVSAGLGFKSHCLLTQAISLHSVWLSWTHLGLVRMQSASTVSGVQPGRPSTMHWHCRQILPMAQSASPAHSQPGAMAVGEAQATHNKTSHDSSDKRERQHFRMFKDCCNGSSCALQDRRGRAETEPAACLDLPGAGHLRAFPVVQLVRNVTRDFGGMIADIAASLKQLVLGQMRISIQ